MLAAGMMLTEQQWKQIEHFLPGSKGGPSKRGRPWASNRACVEGILWVLRTGARWRDVPQPYPHGSTCWRRLRRWEEEGLWLRVWQKLLAQLDQHQLLDWEEAFLDATFVMAKKGAPQWAKPVVGKVRSAWWWSTARAYLWERNSRPRTFPNTNSRRARWRA